MQVDFVADVLQKLRAENINYIESTRDAEQTWYNTVQEISNATLFVKAVSWYMGSNIPGKKREQTNYLGGLSGYMDACKNGTKDWSNFEVKGMARDQMPVVR